jgi:hypothetical protein
MFCKLPQNLTPKRQRVATHQGLSGQRCLGGGLPPAEGSARESTDGDGRRLLSGALNRALNLHRAAVGSHIFLLRYHHPRASPSGLIHVLERQYLAAVTGAGVAVGGAAAVPGVGTSVALAVSGGEVAANISASAFLVMAVAHVHGLDLREVDRRKTLLLGVLMGDSAESALRTLAGRTSRHWAREVVEAVPIESIRRVNRVLGRNFVTRYGTKQGILVLGRVIPFGIGALVGGGGNYIVGSGVVRATRGAFGPPPHDFVGPSNLTGLAGREVLT